MYEKLDNALGVIGYLVGFTLLGSIIIALLTGVYMMIATVFFGSNWSL